MTKEQKEYISSVIIAISFAASLGLVFADNLYNWYKFEQAEKQQKEIKQQQKMASFVNNEIKSK